MRKSNSQLKNSIGRSCEQDDTKETHARDDQLGEVSASWIIVIHLVDSIHDEKDKTVK